MGDFQGHPFRGNQWTQGGARVAEGGGSDAAVGRSDYKAGLVEGSAPTPDHNPTGTFSNWGSESLRSTERNARDQDFESARVFAADGIAIFAKDGDKSSVLFSDDEASKMAGGVLTHNHPSSGPLSFEDVGLCVKKGLRELRAVTADGTLYRLGFSKPLNTGPVLADNARMALLESLGQTAGWLMGRTHARIHAGEITVEQANANWPNEMHEIMLRWAATPEARALGMYYKRVRRG